MKFKRLFLVALLFAIGSFTGSSQEANLGGDLTETDIALFDYDASLAPTITENSTEMRGDVRINDISFPNPVTGEAMKAYLIIPSGEGPFPAVLYVHGLPGSRQEFLNEAIAFAETDKVASLLVDMAWSDASWWGSGREMETDYQETIQHIIELRRAFDVLEAQSFVDSSRMAYVGRDFGCIFGSTLAGVEHRPIAYILSACPSSMLKWLFPNGYQNFPLVDYIAQMESISGLRFIANAAPSTLFFQFSTIDTWTPHEEIFRFFMAASEPKEIELYEANHAIGCANCIADRYEFLRRQFAD